MRAVTLVFPLVLVGYIVLHPTLPFMEGSLLPVTRDTQVHAEPVGDPDFLGWSRVSGSSVKVRNCQFLGLEWFNGRPGQGGVRAQVRFMGPAIDRDDGAFAWTDWRVQLQPDTVSTDSYAVAVHRCHWLWNTKTIFYDSN